jgi:hypothetical protein
MKSVLNQFIELETSKKEGLIEEVKGGRGSGNFGHTGRPGAIGGSSGGSGSGGGTESVKKAKKDLENIYIKEFTKQERKNIASNIDFIYDENKKATGAYLSLVDSNKQIPKFV